VRATLAALVLVLGLFAAIAVVAAAQTSNGLPAYTKGYAKWPKLNARPVTGGSSAHSGVKNTYASKARAGKTFPNGTVIVKSVASRGAKGPPDQVAVMCKVKGKWQWAEFTRSGSRYSKLAVPTSVCTGCHVGAKARDWVFTKR
jgi:hypothetical protein